MKLRGTKAALVVLVSGALMPGVCTSGEDPDVESSSPRAAEIIVGDGDPRTRDVSIKETPDRQMVCSPSPSNWNGHSNVTNTAYSIYSLVVADQVFGNFWYFGTDGAVYEDKEFGAPEVVNQDPLETKYTIADNVRWFDGTLITINDYLLGWVTQDPELLALGLVSGRSKDAEAVFNHAPATFSEYIPEGPQGGVGPKTLTIKFRRQYPGYKAVLSSLLPVRVVVKQLGLEPDVLAAVIPSRDVEAVKKAAKFWNEGWIFQPGQLPDASLIPFSNCYQLKQGGWKDTAPTLEANSDHWGTPAEAESLVFSYVADSQMPQSLQNDDLDVIRPRATVDTVKQLQEISSSVRTAIILEMAWEHLDFNLRDSNVFFDAQGSEKLREAFARCVSHQTVLDRLVKLIKEDAQLLDAHEVLPFQKNYREVTSKSYDGSCDQVDIEGAKQLVAENDIQTPTKVHIGYRMGNQRRTETAVAIQSSCKDAGSEAADVVAQDFFENAVVKGDHEVVLYTWAGSGLIITGQNIQTTGRPQSYGKHSNPKVGEAWNKLTNTLDVGKQVE